MFETALIALVSTYGKIGLTGVMVIQTIIAPIPSEALIMFAGAIGMNVLDVLIFGGIGLIAGSVIAFFIARSGGRPVVVKMIGDKWVGYLDDWVERNGTKAIILTRLVPVIPFDLISYVSGVTRMSFWDYFISTLIGAIPRTLFLAYAGSLTGGLLLSLGLGIEVVFMGGIAGFLVLVGLERMGYIGDLEKTIIGRLIGINQNNTVVERE